MPKTQYAKSGDLHIAYQVTGKGPLDLVLVPGFVSHPESQSVRHLSPDPHVPGHRARRS